MSVPLTSAYSDAASTGQTPPNPAEFNAWSFLDSLVNNAAQVYSATRRLDGSYGGTPSGSKIQAGTTTSSQPKGGKQKGLGAGSELTPTLLGASPMVWLLGIAIAVVLYYVGAGIILAALGGIVSVFAAAAWM